MASPNHLLLAITLPLGSLPRRQPPSLDRAHIAPLPPPPRSPDSDRSSPDASSSDSEHDDDDDDDAAAGARPRARAQKDYTLLLSSTRDRAAKIVTREDGFEKRYLWRCGRCKTVYGYQLDDVHYPSAAAAAAEGKGKGRDKDKEVLGEQGGDGLQQRRERRKRKDYVYFLPGALMPTEELGREVADGQAVFPGVGE
ncbi:hypothetical protein EV426DRAFT_570620 [Tirmania nivea]|nr:hypothetical protein EV426DRAFT_570620 [Tirmania nivea]